MGFLFRWFLSNSLFSHSLFRLVLWLDPDLWHRVLFQWLLRPAGRLRPAAGRLAFLGHLQQAAAQAGSSHLSVQSALQCLEEGRKALQTCLTAELRCGWLWMNFFFFFNKSRYSLRTVYVASISCIYFFPFCVFPRSGTLLFYYHSWVVDVVKILAHLGRLSLRKAI